MGTDVASGQGHTVSSHLLILATLVSDLCIVLFVDPLFHLVAAIFSREC